MVEIDFLSEATHYASGPRATMAVVMQQHNSLRQADFLEEVFSRIPIRFFIVNQHRQVIFMNDLIAAELKEKQIDLGLGFRPGEIMSCTNAFLEPAGCGTSHQCKICGIVNTILDSVANDQLTIREASFESNYGGDYQSIDYEVTAKPFYWQNERFVIITLDNISQIKRREHLEQTFFHDLLNKAMAISGLTEIIGVEADQEQDQMFRLLRRGVIDLTNEIVFQRSLTEAESGEFSPRWEALSSMEILQGIKEDFLSYEVVANKTIVISDQSQNIDFLSDKTILNRILTNLIKNSLEAIQSGQVVTIGSTHIGSLVQFWVHNETTISDDVRTKIFKRSFSTKGKGRGLGTYSVKLFTEHYLRGKVSFESTHEQGTIFRINLPVGEDLE